MPRAISRIMVIAIAVLVIMIAVVGALIYIQQPAQVAPLTTIPAAATTQTTRQIVSPTTPPITPMKAKYKDTLVIGTTDSIQTTLDPAEAYDYLGVNNSEYGGRSIRI